MHSSTEVSTGASSSWWNGKFAAADEGSKVAHIVFRARISQRFCVLRVTEVFLRSSAGNFVASFHICEHSYSRYSAVQQAVLSSIKLP